MPQKTIDLLNRGIRANQADRFRRANLVRLPEQGSLVVTGDIHGHRRNFERIVSYADLGNHPDRHLILQEIIHGGPEDDTGGCLSYQLLFDAVRFKLEFPDQVHLIMGNHDTAYICSAEVMKNGKEMVHAMSMAINREFQGAGSSVNLAIRQFLFSQPLAIRCASGTWISHSLPSDQLAAKFDPGVFDRELQLSDCQKPGSAYLLTWGRRHSPELLNTMAQKLDARLFILGHQPQPEGWRIFGENLIILACDHDHGSLLDLDLSKLYTAQTLSDRLIPLASIA
jgi:hypothetical protein